MDELNKKLDAENLEIKAEEKAAKAEIKDIKGKPRKTEKKKLRLNSIADKLFGKGKMTYRQSKPDPRATIVIKKLKEQNRSAFFKADYDAEKKKLLSWK